MAKKVTTNRRAVRVGVLGGVIGGLLAGALGGAFARCLEVIGPPTADEALRGALVGGAAGTVAGLVAGLLSGWWLAPRGPRFSFLGSLFTAFWAVAAAVIEAEQLGPLHAARPFLVGTIALPLGLSLLPHLMRGLSRARWLVVAWLVLCLIGAGLGPPIQKFALPGSLRVEPVVQLWSSTLPPPLGPIAAHHWFLSFDPAEGRWHRWEVWQFADQGGTSWGHVHRDLLSLTGNTGGGEAEFLHEWHGPEAEALLQTLQRSFEYPYRGRYLAWPGPNSTTYIAWVFRESGVAHDIEPRGLGQNYLGPVGAGVTTTRTGVQVESTLLGLKVGLDEGVELHFAGFVFGIDFWRPAVKTPLGRFGFAE